MRELDPQPETTKRRYATSRLASARPSPRAAFRSRTTQVVSRVRATAQPQSEQCRVGSFCKVQASARPYPHLRRSQTVLRPCPSPNPCERERADSWPVYLLEARSQCLIQPKMQSHWDQTAALSRKEAIRRLSGNITAEAGSTVVVSCRSRNRQGDVLAGRRSWLRTSGPLTRNLKRLKNELSGPSSSARASQRKPSGLPAGPR